jgi:hypothetical protein
MKIGQRVTIKKPSDVDEYPVWMPEMDRFDGRTVTVDRISDRVFYIRGASYSFNLTWLGQKPEKVKCDCKWRYCRSLSK